MIDNGLLAESHQTLKQIISKVLDSLQEELKAANLNEIRLNKIVKILIMNEIEKCVKKNFGKVR